MEHPEELAPSEQFEELYRRKFSEFRSSRWTPYECQKETNCFTMRVSGRDVDCEKISAILNSFDNDQVISYKINVQISLFLRINTSHTSYVPQVDEEDDEKAVRFFYPSGNTSLFDESHLVRSHRSLKEFIELIKNKDIESYALTSLPSSKWLVDHIGALHFTVSYCPGIIYVHDSPETLVPRPRQSSQSSLGCPIKKLPLHITKSNNLTNIKKGRAYYQDHLCLIRVVSHALLISRNEKAEGSNLDNLVGRLYVRLTGGQTPMSAYQGTKMADIDQLEKITDTSINIYSFIEEEDNVEIPNFLVCNRKSYNEGLVVNILDYDGHAIFIRDLQGLAHSYLCGTCGLVFHESWHFERHCSNNNCHEKEVTKDVYPGGIYEAPMSLNDKLACYNLNMVEPFCKQFAVFDFEAVLKPINEVKDKTVFTSEHIPVSVAICSNVEGFTTPKFIFNGDDPQELIDDFIDYLKLISTKNYENFCELNEELLTTLQNRIEMAGEELKADNEALDKNKKFVKTKSDQSLFQMYTTLEAQVKNYGQTLTCVSFNGGRYDLNLIKKELFKNFSQSAFGPSSLIKRDNTFLSVVSPCKTLKFIDIMAFLTPGTSYAKFVECFDCVDRKGKFPFAWFTDVNKLNERSLPPIEAWTNELKDTPLTVEEYNYFQGVWEREDMRTMFDYLRWYNVLDVEPFVEALSKMVSLFNEHKLDLLKDAVSISKLAFQFLMSSIPPDIKHKSFFYIPSVKHREIDDDLRAHIVGGASIIFHRRMEAGETKIREFEEACAPHDTAKSCHGVDCNGLYCKALDMEMPCGYPVIRRKTKDFVPENVGSRDLKSLQYLEWFSQTNNLNVIHKFNSREVKVGSKQLKVDGFIERAVEDGGPIVLEFHGCFFHGCPECHPDKDAKRPGGDETWGEILQSTKDKDWYIRHLGFELKIMWECSWDKLLKQNELAKKISKDPFFQNTFIPKSDKNGPLSEQDMLKAIQKDKIFGFVICDVSTPDHLKPKFNEFPLVFKHAQITLDNCGEFMSTIAAADGLLKKPKELLISTHSAQQILLATPLIKFYLEQGLSINNISKIYQYRPVRCFSAFVATCQERRILGDIDPSKALYSRLYKDMGNHSYGYSLTRKDKQNDIIIAGKKEFRKLKEKPQFKSAQELGEGSGLYEIVLKKKTVCHDLPLQIGSMIYFLSKLWMLKFIYNCMYRFFIRKKWQILEMDTDSLYYMTSQNHIEDCLHPHLKLHFYENYHNWFPPPYCTKHHALFIQTKMSGAAWEEQCPDCTMARIRGNRTVGLFKSEYSNGTWFVGLCSKTYAIGVDNTTNNMKASAKGINLKLSKIQKEQFVSVLEKQKSTFGLLKSIKIDKDRVVTYEQKRFGLSFFYAKRICVEDSYETKVLDI